MAEGMEDCCTSARLQAARELLSALKAAYDSLPGAHRSAVREVLAGGQRRRRSNCPREVEVCEQSA